MGYRIPKSQHLHLVKHYISQGHGLVFKIRNFIAIALGKEFHNDGANGSGMKSKFRSNQIGQIIPLHEGCGSGCKIRIWATELGKHFTPHGSGLGCKSCISGDCIIHFMRAFEWGSYSRSLSTWVKHPSL